VTVIAAVLTLLCIGGALFAPWLATQNPFDASSLNLNEAFREPGSPGHLLGTDDQGRDLFSTILYGARISLGVGLAAVLLPSRRIAWACSAASAAYLTP
jgi:peptide/nickel transport system permease protein